MTALVVDDLEVRFGAVRAVRGLSFTVEPGEIVGLIGPNGAGKSSTLHAIMGAAPVAAGDVRLGGASLVGRKPEDVARSGIALVPEGRRIFGELTVEENLRLGALWRGNRAECTTSLAEVYRMFRPLAERKTQVADTLSGGERQMLAVGRALMSRPKLLLLDEPSLGLAPRITAQIMATLRRLRDEQQLTVVLVEQNARSALSVADTAVVLNLGKVVAQGNAAELAGDDKLRHAYLGF
jgi:branched-chain amino acid transport system ATP-binding protein